MRSCPSPAFPPCLRAGLLLMALKLTVESALLWFIDGVAPSFGLLLLPIASLRQEWAGADASTSLLAVAIWSVPFAWIGLSMSVRRAVDAGLPPLLGLAFGLPVLNYGLMLWLAMAPSAPDPDQGAQRADRLAHSGLGAALRGVALSVLIGAPVVALFAAFAGSYGAPVFLSSPFLIGMVAGWQAGRDEAILPARGFAVGALAIVVCMALLLLFALEGVICLAMAAPVAIPAGGLGGALGAVWAASRSGTPRGPGFAMALALPLFGLVATTPPAERVVVSEVIVDAPPERVWPQVIAFPEITASAEESWLFRVGVAMPLRARIEGSGVGAVRHCEFTTGAFVEPIRVWDPPRRLAFDVTSQPSPMRELSPWEQVHAPHLVTDTLRSRRGEFELQALPGGKTRLIGRTVYTVAMQPEAYWAAWVDAIVHQIHLRVLHHIARVATPLS